MKGVQGDGKGFAGWLDFNKGANDLDTRSMGLGFVPIGLGRRRVDKIFVDGLHGYSMAKCWHVGFHLPQRLECGKNRNQNEYKEMARCVQEMLACGLWFATQNCVFERLAWALEKKR